MFFLVDTLEYMRLEVGRVVKQEGQRPKSWWKRRGKVRRVFKRKTSSFREWLGFWGQGWGVILNTGEKVKWPRAWVIGQSLMSTSTGNTKNRFLEQIVGVQRIRWRILREQSSGSQALGSTLKDRVGKNCGIILYYWSITKSQSCFFFKSGLIQLTDYRQLGSKCG